MLSNKEMSQILNALASMRGHDLNSNNGADRYLPLKYITQLLSGYCENECNIEHDTINNRILLNFKQS